jgi:hypothetical protein
MTSSAVYRIFNRGFCHTGVSSDDIGCAIDRDYYRNLTSDLPLFYFNEVFLFFTFVSYELFIAQVDGL